MISARSKTPPRLNRQAKVLERPDPSLDLPAFDRRLSPGAKAPIAVAYSGGGDSLAVLIAAHRWAERVGRRVLALHVDHGLQAASANWARLAAHNAERLGLGFRVLTWTGDKPSIGLPAAARTARHTLIADAARTAGARVIVFGHTADDEMEAGLMRAQGSNLGRLSEWRPSPVWPQGRGLFLLRPMLGLRRAEIRRRLAPLGFDWVEDPANSDPHGLRARARAQIGGEGDFDPATIEDQSSELADLAQQARIDAAGALRIARADLLAAPPAIARRFLSAALICVSGRVRPPRRLALDALLARLEGAKPVTATLAGARLGAGDEILILRESGSYRRHGAPEIRLEPGQTVVWDGRFAVTAGPDLKGLVVPLGGAVRKYQDKQKDNFPPWPREALAALPAVIDDRGRMICPILAGGATVTAESLVEARLNGVCGVISREPTI